MKSQVHWCNLLYIAPCITMPFLVQGCADTSYLLQAAKGHIDIIRAARPVQELLADDTTPDALKQRLQVAQELRRYAITTLKLPDSVSFKRYTALPRRAVVWNVVAASAYSLKPKQWCFPVTGCVSYRGYFSEQDAQDLASTLRMEGWETSVQPVPAYSTLGWTDWLGGDPLLSTFIYYPLGELVRMIFHEMAHQVLFVKDDTAFNESFATAVERLGSAAWLANPAQADVQLEYARHDARRKAFRALTTATRSKLQSIYADAGTGALHVERQEATKMAAYEDFHSAYRQLKTGWGGYSRYDAWVETANNGAFAALAAYDDWVDAFEVLFAHQRGDWAAFYAAAKALADKPKEERTLELEMLKSANTSS